MAAAGSIKSRLQRVAEVAATSAECLRRISGAPTTVNSAQQSAERTSSASPSSAVSRLAEPPLALAVCAATTIATPTSANSMPTTTGQRGRSPSSIHASRTTKTGVIVVSSAPSWALASAVPRNCVIMVAATMPPSAKARQRSPDVHAGVASLGLRRAASQRASVSAALPMMTRSAPSVTGGISPNPARLTTYMPPHRHAASSGSIPARRRSSGVMALAHPRLDGGAQPRADDADELVGQLVLWQSAAIEDAQIGARIELAEGARVLQRREAGVLAPEQQNRHRQPHVLLIHRRIQRASDEAGGGIARVGLVRQRVVIVNQIVADLFAILIDRAQEEADGRARG